jgi:hypothetical protein
VLQAADAAAFRGGQPLGGSVGPHLGGESGTTIACGRNEV